MNVKTSYIQARFFVGWMALWIASPAQGAHYTNDTDWGGANWTLANGDVVAGVHTNVGHFSIPVGVTNTVQPYNSVSLQYGRVTIFAASGNVAGKLLADGAGLPEGEGDGAGVGGQNGAGHGGRGGVGVLANTTPGDTYGSPDAPDQLGSGGGASGLAGGFGGAGGGALILDVAGELMVNGIISAAGGAGTSRGGGGSGGSIWLTADRIAGSGTITADGGDGGNVTRSGGGGGGRIALDAAQNDFAGTIRAQGKPGVNGPGRSGTFNFISDATRDLVIDADIALPPGTNWVFRSLTVKTGNQFEIQSTQGTAEENYTNEVTSRVRVVYDVSVASNAAISADGIGYGPQSGPGTGTYSWGAGYGGKGGQGYSSVGGPGDAIGSAYAPNRLGSGGGNNGGAGGAGGGALILDAGRTLTVDGSVSACGGTPVGTGGLGSGGSIWLTADRITGNGTISASGGVQANSKSGGGGGGRILMEYGPGEKVKTSWLNPASLPDKLDFKGSVKADGSIVDGSNGAKDGEDGSIVLLYRPPPAGTVLRIR